MRWPQASPGPGSKSYRRAVPRLNFANSGLKQVVLESAVDYHRVLIDEDYEKVLVRFLTSRTQAKGLR